MRVKPEKHENVSARVRWRPKVCGRVRKCPLAHKRGVHRVRVPGVLRIRNARNTLEGQCGGAQSGRRLPPRLSCRRRAPAAKAETPEVFAY